MPNNVLSFITVAFLALFSTATANAQGLPEAANDACRSTIGSQKNFAVVISPTGRMAIDCMMLQALIDPFNVPFAETPKLMLSMYSEEFEENGVWRVKGMPDKDLFARTVKNSERFRLLAAVLEGNTIVFHYTPKENIREARDKPTG